MIIQKNMEEANRKEIFCYDQNKNKRTSIHNSKNKWRESFEQKKKGTKIYKNPRNNYRRYQGSNFKNNKKSNPTAIEQREVTITYNKINPQREPLKW